MVRGLVQNVLESSGFKVLVANRGAEALEACTHHPGSIHLLLTDVVMPGGMSGREVAERLTALRPEMKVLYMSGYTDDAVVRHGVATEGISFIQKPFLPTMLLEKINTILGNSG